jgi:small conductance mechanosensitive channel
VFHFAQLIQQLPDFWVFAAILGATVLLEWLLRRVLWRYLTKAAVEMKSDVTNFRYLSNSLSGIVYTVGIIFAVREYPPLRGVAGSLLTGAGILTIAVSFASQQALSNIVSGFFIVLFKPFRVNDRLRIKDVYAGVVEDITLRHTVIRDVENRRILIPNSVINQEIIVNSDLNDNKICKFVEFQITHDANADRAMQIMAEEALKHPKTIDNRSEESIKAGKSIVTTRVVKINLDGVTVRVAAWTTDFQQGFELYCDLLATIKKRFDAEGIVLAKAANK